MDTLATFRQRLGWTKSWLRNNTQPQPEVSDEYDLVYPDGSSDHGVKSLPSDSMTSEYMESEYSHWRYFIDFDCECQAHLRGEVPMWRMNEWSEDWTPAIDLELAGRRNDGPDFKDSRSGAKARQRARKEREKYFGFRAVKRGDVGRPQYKNDWIHGLLDCSGKVLLRDQPVVTMTKHLLFQQAQLWPRPPTYHRRRMSKDREPWTQKVQARWASRRHANGELQGQIMDAHDILADEELRIVYGFSDCCDGLEEWDLAVRHFVQRILAGEEPVDDWIGLATGELDAMEYLREQGVEVDSEHSEARGDVYDRCQGETSCELVEHAPSTPLEENLDKRTSEIMPIKPDLESLDLYGRVQPTPAD